jgi:hypothetical protein
LSIADGLKRHRTYQFTGGSAETINGAMGMDHDIP